ncbi:sensor histidine kinase [Saccharicrinis fermentans]|uniref:Putative sensor-like histidine kinase YehU n=1 Tax=Saccharicrinis fermentans DSM 9555 = JCM 21142 TaxID=869213 RepID=W7XYG5_9BACT|nr:histidine kinase [Saccharicrinis fermentans]GAF03650.1 putative sensor-like histidine kinase YehU [Saccharicrinis fermentans DSM 9555 = JCM 21142]
MQIHISKFRSWLPHILGILFVMTIPLFVFDQSDNRLVFWKYGYYYQMIFMMAAFYTNYLLIVPRLYFLKRKWYFFVTIFLFAIATIILVQMGYEILDFEGVRERLALKRMESARKVANFTIHPKLIDNFYLLVLVLSASTGIAIIKQLNHSEKMQHEKEKAHKDTELAFLKNQISPHFFFNALNNIYALIAIDGDKAQRSVEKLSALMRYLIYESDIKTIALSKEFAFIQNYIDLMRQRLSSKVQLDVNITHKHPQTHIPPLLFIPFIENAFKHGVSYREKSFIEIGLKEENKQIIFTCNNSVPTKKNVDDSKSGGLGIVNIKKRLHLIYGDRAVLKMDEDENVFSVCLIVPLEAC